MTPQTQSGRKPVEELTGLVTINNGQAITTSLRIAEVFGKEHFNVIQSIERLDIPEDFRKLNFQVSEYSTQNRLGKTIKYKMYVITRDGFTLLAMGFTGRKAMEFKIAYINAFNEMERRAQNPSPEDILMNIIDTNGAQWILDRLERCDLLEYYAPEHEIGTFTPDGAMRSTLRRASNPIRGGRNMQSVLLRAGHPDLFANMLIKLLTGENHGKNDYHARSC